jgi:hypothetical protein
MGIAKTDEFALYFLQLFSPLLLARGRTKVRDSEAAAPALLNYPHPPLSLPKGEATDIRAAVSIGPIVRIHTSQDYFNSYG